MTHRSPLPGGSHLPSRPQSSRRHISGTTSIRRLLVSLAAVLPVILGLQLTTLLPAGAVDATGQFAMDAAISGASSPTTSPPFHWADLFNAGGGKILTHATYSNLLDSTFIPDYATPDNSYFTPTKDINSISGGGWACSPQNTPTAKDDIQNTYAAVFQTPKSAPENGGDIVAYLGVERGANNGDSFAGFWLFKDPTVGCSGSNNFSGHHTDGDILILTNFTNGGGTSSVTVYRWTGTDTAGAPMPVVLPNGGNVCGVSPGGTAGDSVCAISNMSTISSPWPTAGTPPTSHLPNEFTEAAIDLTQLFGGTASGPCFSNFMAETRSSQQITATLKDFAGGLLNTCIVPTVNTSASGHGNTNFPGSAQHDVATMGVPSGDPTPTGSITFFLCGPAQVTSAGCPKGAGAQIGSAVPLNSGSATSTPDVTGTTTPNDLATGTYCWGAQYTPDSASVDRYLPSYGTDASAECFTIAKASPTIGTTASFSSGTSDLSSTPKLADSVTLSGVATGPAGEPAGETVNFSLFGPFAAGTTPSCATGANEPVFTTTGTLAKSGSNYVASTASSYTATSIGTYVWVASYAGDTFNNGATEPCNGSNESLTVTTPQLHITKSADNATVSAGSPIGFTVTVSNDAAATGTATGVSVSDLLPGGAGVHWSIDTQSGTACTVNTTAPQTLSCSISSLAPGASYSVHVTSGTTASSCAVYPNTATASATNQTSGNVQASASTTVQCPNVSVTKTPDHAIVNAGDPIGFTVVVSNSGAAGTGTATNVTLSDPLPAGSGIDWSIDTQDASACTVSGAVGSQQVNCTIGTMAPGATYTFHVTSATAFASCSQYTNTASVSVGNENGGPFTGTGVSTVDCPGLHILKTADATPVSTGTTIGFHVTISNSGPGTADSVTEDDPLPAGNGVDWMIASQSGSSCAINGAVGSQDLQCSLGNMGPGASYTIHITSTTNANSAGTYPNTATASAGNAPSVHSSATIVVLAPNVMLAKSADHGTVNAGDPIGFTVTITNPGTSATVGTATTVNISDPLPSGTGVSWSIDTQTASACAVNSTPPQTLSCALTNFAPGASYTVHITSTTVFASCAVYNNNASGTVGNENGTLSAHASTTVQCPSLGITKTADATPVSTGTDIGFRVTVSNGGPGTAYGVTISDPLPTGSGISWSIDTQPTQGSCSIVGAQVNCSLGSMTSGQSLFFHVTSHTDATSAGTYPNTATVSATNAPSSQASATIVVLPPNVQVAKAADNAVVNAGADIGFTVTITNPGTSANTGTATGVSVNDPLPAGTGVSWSINSQSGTACHINGSAPTQTLVCSIATFAPGSTYTVHVTSHTAATSCTQYPNQVSVTAGNQVGTLTASASTSVACPDVSVVKTADNTTVSAGDSIGFNVVVSNGNSTGTGTANNVVLNDPLPAGNGVSWSIDHQTASACTINGSVPTQTLHCVIATLAPGASYTVHVTSGTVFASCTQYPNTATVTVGNESGTFTSQASITVQCPSLAITKTADATPVSTGTSIGFQVVVSNGGPGIARSVTVNDPLPAGSGVDWSIASQTSTLCVINGSVGSQDLQCTLGDMASGASYTIHITSPTDGTSAGTYPNTATASATNAPSVQSSATIVVLAPDVTVVKTADNSVVNAGSPMGFTVTISNSAAQGTGTAMGVTVADPLPMGTGISWSIDQQTSTKCMITVTDGGTPGEELDCMAFNLAPGASYTVHVTTNTDFQSCAVYNNQANVTVPNQSPSTLHANASATVQCPSLGIVKTADATPVSTGTPIAFTVVVSNGGPGTATAVQINDPLPSGTGIDWTISPAYTGPGTCAINGSVGDQTLTCSLGDMAAEASVTVHIRSGTTSGSAGTYPNTATVTASNAPTEQSSATIVVQAPALTITKTADATPVTAGGTVGFTVAVSNSSAAGTGTATGVTINDPLPSANGASWSISPAYSGPGTCSITGSTGNQTLVCNIGTLAKGATASVHITSSTSSSTCNPLDNTASVAASNGAGAQASASITMVCVAVQAINVVVPATGLGSIVPSPATALIASGIMLIMGVVIRRRRTRD